MGRKFSCPQNLPCVSLDYANSFTNQVLLVSSKREKDHVESKGACMTYQKPDMRLKWPREITNRISGKLSADHPGQNFKDAHPTRQQLRTAIENLRKISATFYVDCLALRQVRALRFMERPLLAPFQLTRQTRHEDITHIDEDERNHDARHSAVLSNIDERYQVLRMEFLLPSLRTSRQGTHHAIPSVSLLTGLLHKQPSN